MNPRIKHLIQYPFEVQLSDVALLQDEIEKYPYFSTLRILLLFGLKEFNHNSYQEELKKTSIHSPSRVALYHYLKKERQISTPIESVEKAFEDKIESVTKDEAIEKTSLHTKDSFETKEEEEEAFLDEPIIDESSETDGEKSIETKKEMTFSEWLNLSIAHDSKDKTSSSKPNEREIKYKLIDEFIEKSPKIIPVTTDAEIQPIRTKTESSAELSDLMTETLAQIYVEQKMYAKAIRAYKILSLKYPDKSEDFDLKIDEIKALQNG